MNQWEREYQQMEKDYASGRLTKDEFNKQVRELERAQSDQARADAQDAADAAYEVAMARHYF